MQGKPSYFISIKNNINRYSNSFKIGSSSLITMSKNLKSLLFFAFFLIFNINQSIAKTDLLLKHQEDLFIIENYLNNIKQFSANFYQESNEKTAKGKFFLSKNDKNGKIRIEYQTKPKILIIINGSKLIYQDLELEETSYIDSSSTPASFLLKNNISFSDPKISITNIIKNEQEIIISLKQNQKEQPQIESKIAFNLNPTFLKRIESTNELGQNVILRLENIDTSTPISNKLFIAKNQNLSQ